ncbi:sensor histidine kinase [Streptomyces sp. NBC_00859]|uniref:sensor histidine kinase n=1 Tax=Streptomyces sp. NBC_00859 TaxID=2903682 RepID=UPI0038656746|nr:HAMP domain-containing histidine kinase [Streptomyces sp. NBC_00859]
MRLSTRIALVVGAVVPLLVVASGWVLVGLVAKDLHTQADQRLDERARSVATAARGLLRVASHDRPQAEQAHQRKLFTSALDIGIRLTGPDGTVMDGPQPDPSVPLPGTTKHPVSVRSHGKTWRVMTIAVKGGQPRARVHGTLWLFSPDSASQAQIQLVRNRVITVAVLAAPLSAVLAWAAAAGAARPLRRLQQRTIGLDPHAGPARLEHTPTRIAEVDDLAHTLQTFLARYDEQAARTVEALATARSFAAAASHELRTPLMSMQTNLDILGAFQDLGPQDRRDTVDDLRREHGRLVGLLVMLRSLAQGDLVEAEALAPVDLADLADACVSDVRRSHPGAEVTFSAKPGLTVHGWQPGLRSLLDNLLSNALTHGRSTDSGTHVTVTLRPSGDGAAPAAVLTVDDRGPGVPPGQRRTILRRFHRRPGSPGYGLGLTLVGQQIALHRAHLRVLDNPVGQGARFEVTFPLAPAGTSHAALPPHRDWLTDTAGHRRETGEERP